MGDPDEPESRATAASNLPPPRIRHRPAPERTGSAPASPPAENLKHDFEVGYGRPPKAHQFQPGQSGNPKGRPKGSRSISTILSQELDLPITATIGGKSVTMSRRNALVKRVVEKALGGDLQAFGLLLKLDAPEGPSAEGRAATAEELSPAETALLHAALAKITKEQTP